MPVPRRRAMSGSTLRRVVSLTVLLVVAVVGLTGCFTADVRLTVASDDTVSGAAVVAVDRAVVARSGSVTHVVTELVHDVLPDDPPSGSVTTSPYEDADRVGVTVVLSDVGLDAFAGTAGGGAPVLQITRDGDHYLVSGRIDLTPRAMGVEDDVRAQRLLVDATVSLQLTFPGPVVTTNGSIDAGDRDRVAWNLPMGEATDLQATAQAAPTAHTWPLAAAAVVVVLVVSAAAFVLRLRSRRAGGRHAHRSSDR